MEMAHTLRVFWKHHIQGEYQHHVDVMFLRLLLCTLLMLTSLFMTALECILLKQQSRFIRARELKHGFVLVKTWLLIACGTGFYAIIPIMTFEQCHEKKDISIVPLMDSHSRKPELQFLVEGFLLFQITYELAHDKMACVLSKDTDQPGHPPSKDSDQPGHPPSKDSD